MAVDWHALHRKVIENFLHFLNKGTDQFVLKGGTALFLCYGLNRFSEDIDLDSRRRDIKEVVCHFCELKGYSFTVVEDMPIVKCCMINYGSEAHRLKIEVSYRNANLDAKDVTCINGIQVYSINRFAQLKSAAYLGREKIRDLFDLTFICNHYYDQLSHDALNGIRDVLSVKGIDQFDYLIATQDDPLIDKDMLADSFLKSFEKLGLLIDQDNALIQEQE